MSELNLESFQKLLLEIENLKGDIKQLKLKARRTSDKEEELKELEELHRIGITLNKHIKWGINEKGIVEQSIPDKDKDINTNITDEYLKKEREYNSKLIALKVKNFKELLFEIEKTKDELTKLKSKGKRTKDIEEDLKDLEEVLVLGKQLKKDSNNISNKVKNLNKVDTDE